MAITINQQPTTPNIANNNLVFSVTSSYLSQPQFQYVVDIKDANNNLLQRVKQQPNPSGKGVFDLSQIIKFNVGPADHCWKTDFDSTFSYYRPSPTVHNTSSAGEFKIYFGEEYGTSVSSSTAIYNGVTNVTGGLAPAKTGSSYYYNLDGFLNPNDKVNWNWASGSKLTERLIDDQTFTYQYGLTDFPATQSINISDYHTISFLNGNVAGTTSATIAQDIYAYKIEWFDATGSQIDLYTIYNYNPSVGTPRTSYNDLWYEVYTDQRPSTRLLHFPVGYQNMVDGGLSVYPNASYYVVTFHEQGTDGTVNDNGVWGSYRFDLNKDCSAYTPVRFAWKNRYGVWDYYNYTLVSTTVSNIERQNYEQSFVNFSTTTSTSVYDKTRRGNTNYYNEIKKQRTIESDWLDQTYADLLNEMFYSADVYIQEGTDMLPVVMTNASITEKTNPAGQKLFKYTAEYRLANDEQPRL